MSNYLIRKARYLICHGAFILMTISAFAQIPNCSRSLRIAESLYQQGNFHEIPTLLHGCLTRKGTSGFTSQEKSDALRILTLAYIYQEEPAKADSSILTLLKNNHLFKINETTDPLEFIALYNTFRTWPLFSVGLKLGVNYTYPMVTENYSISSGTTKGGKYIPSLGLQAGIVFETELFRNHDHKSKWIAAPELMYRAHSFVYTNNKLTGISQRYSSLNATINNQSIDLNLIMQYKIVDRKLVPYISFGPSISYLISASAQLETQNPPYNNLISGPTTDLHSSLNPVEFALIGGLGVKYSFGALYLRLDVAYRHGFTNFAKADTRNNTEAALEYGYVSNDYIQRDISVSINGFLPLFFPKKYLK